MESQNDDSDKTSIQLISEFQNIISSESSLKFVKLPFLPPAYFPVHNSKIQFQSSKVLASLTLWLFESLGFDPDEEESKKKKSFCPVSSKIQNLENNNYNTSGVNVLRDSSLGHPLAESIPSENKSSSKLSHRNLVQNVQRMLDCDSNDEEEMRSVNNEGERKLRAEKCLWFKGRQWRHDSANRILNKSHAPMLRCSHCFEPLIGIHEIPDNDKSQSNKKEDRFENSYGSPMHWEDSNSKPTYQDLSQIDEKDSRMSSESKATPNAKRRKVQTSESLGHVENVSVELKTDNCEDNENSFFKFNQFFIQPTGFPPQSLLNMSNLFDKLFLVHVKWNNSPYSSRQDPSELCQSLSCLRFVDEDKNISRISSILQKKLNDKIKAIDDYSLSENVNSTPNHLVMPDFIFMQHGLGRNNKFESIHQAITIDATEFADDYPEWFNCLLSNIESSGSVNCSWFCLQFVLSQIFIKRVTEGFLLHLRSTFFCPLTAKSLWDALNSSADKLSDDNRDTPSEGDSFSPHPSETITSSSGSSSSSVSQSEVMKRMHSDLVSTPARHSRHYGDNQNLVSERVLLTPAGWHLKRCPLPETSGECGQCISRATRKRHAAVAVNYFLDEVEQQDQHVELNGIEIEKFEIKMKILTLIYNQDVQLFFELRRFGYLHLRSLNRAPPNLVRLSELLRRDTSLKQCEQNIWKWFFTIDKLLSVHSGVPCADESSFKYLFSNNKIRSMIQKSTEGVCPLSYADALPLASFVE